jgi:hypothetical protein
VIADYSSRTGNAYFPAGIDNDATTYPSRTAGDSAYLTGPAALYSQVSTEEGAFFADIQSGCNPLDASELVLANAAVTSAINSWTSPSTLGAYAGADGFVRVALHAGTATVQATNYVCYDLDALGNPTPGGCSGTPGGQVGVSNIGPTSTPTIDWIWTGAFS